MNIIFVLMLSIVFEVIASSSLKLTAGFKKNST